MKKPPFSPLSLVLFIACAAILFALSILLSAYEGSSGSTGKKAEPGTYSVSAIGHAGLYDFMKRMERPVKRSKGSVLSMVGHKGTLVVAEPEWASVGESDNYKYRYSMRLLLVLPKWTGIPDQEKPAWVTDAKLANLFLAQQTLTMVTARGEVFRKKWPEEWKHNEIGIMPTGSGTIQLIRSHDLLPLVGDPDGILLGEYTEGKRKVWILSDPDLLSNHGIGKGENAAFMLALIDRLRYWENDDGSAPIVFDETIHGYREAHGTITGLLFRFPFVVITLLTCLSAILLIWSASGRFGAPERVKPELDFGKTKLIDNSARLLDYTGHHGTVLRRYLRMTLRLAAKALHAPQLEDAALVAWLDRIGKARGVTESCSAILQSFALSDTDKTQHLSRLFESARAIHRWKGELLNEHPTHRRHS